MHAAPSSSTFLRTSPLPQQTSLVDHSRSYLLVMLVPSISTRASLSSWFQVDTKGSTNHLCYLFVAAPRHLCITSQSSSYSIRNKPICFYHSDKGMWLMSNKRAAA